MRIKAVVGFTVEDDRLNRWWFPASGLDDATLLFNLLTRDGRRLDGDGTHITTSVYVNVIAWDRHPSQEDALGLIVHQIFLPGED